MDLTVPFEEKLAVFLRTHPYRDVTVNGANWHYLLCGEGKTVLVFLTGGMGLSYLYMPYVEALEQEYRVLTFDYPYAYSRNEELAEGISGFLRYLGIDEAVFIGSSYGGYLAQILARRYPEQTAGLCLFSTAGLSKNTVTSLKNKYQKAAPVLLWVLRHVPYAWLKPLMIRACMKHGENLSEEEHSHLLEMFRFIYRDYTRELDLHMTGLLIDLMNQVPCVPEEFAYLEGKVLLVLPENDDSFTPQMQKELIEMMPGCTVTEGIDSGHLSTLLETDRCVQEIRRFVKQD